MLCLGWVDGGAGMTENEAIEFMKRYLDTECYTDKCVSAHNMAIKALEKQIPKRLEIRNATCADIESGLRDFITTQGKICWCPTCKDTICVSGIEYCWYCGQKLDWGDEE